MLGQFRHLYGNASLNQSADQRVYRLRPPGQPPVPPPLPPKPKRKARPTDGDGSAETLPALVGLPQAEPLRGWQVDDRAMGNLYPLVFSRSGQIIGVGSAGYLFRFDNGDERWLTRRQLRPIAIKVGDQVCVDDGKGGDWGVVRDRAGDDYHLYLIVSQRYEWVNVKSLLVDLSGLTH